jgi:ABC-2 type transport system ATP-binding protein
MNIIVQTKNLNKKYKYKHALKDFNITIRKGDIYGLIGVNGAGKSTLIKLITGITQPTSGDLYLFGTRNDLDLQRRKIGSVIENPSFYPNMSAYQNLEYYATVMATAAGPIDKKTITDLLLKVKLDPNSKQPFKQFSLGMKQRLGIAFALLNDPEFVILDEPTNGWDPIGILELRDIILNLNKNGVTFLICSHILSELSQIATKYGIVHNGEFIKELTNDDLISFQQETVIVKIPNDTGKRFMEALHKWEYIYGIGHGIYTVHITRGINTFLRELVEENIEIVSITQIQTSLEDIFKQTISGGNTK